MLLHEHFGAWCRHLGIREALLLQPDGHRPRIVASCGVKRTAVQAAPSLAAASNKIRPATAPFRSKYIIVLDIGKRASAPAPSFRLVVGLRKRSGVDLARARELAAQVRLLAENLALRSKVDRLSASATLGELVLHSVHDLNNSLATVVACVEMLETQAAHAGSEAVGGGQEPARHGVGHRTATARPKHWPA